MLFREACLQMTKGDRLDLWMDRLSSVDRAIENSTTGWSLEFWNSVRRKLVRQLELLNVDARER